MSLDKRISDLEESAFQIDIIDSFASRGWALYECNAGLPMDGIDSLSSLAVIVSMGREKKALAFGVKYILLPLNKRDGDWEIIQKMISLVTSQGRGPYYAEIVEDERGIPQIIARFWIDSVILDPPFLYLQPEPRFSNILDKNRIKGVQGKAIEIPLSELWRVRKQVMMALR